MRTQKPKKDQTISFRLDDQGLAILLDRAKLFEEKSQHKLARRYVLEALLADQDRQQLLETINTLVEQIRAMRECQLKILKVTLVSQGMDLEKADTYIKKNFLI